MEALRILSDVIYQFVERASAERDEGRMAGEQDSSPPPFLPVLDL